MRLTVLLAAAFAILYPASQASAQLASSGESVLFESNLRRSALGDVPQWLDLKAGIIAVGERDGERYLVAPQPSDFEIALGRPLPSMYTVEFSVILTDNNVYSTVQLRAALAGDLNGYAGVSRRADHAVAGCGGRWSSIQGNDVDISNEIPGWRTASIYQCRIVVDGDTARVFTNGELSATARGVTFGESDRLHFVVPASSIASTYIGEIRITGAGTGTVTETQRAPETGIETTGIQRESTTLATRGTAGTTTGAPSTTNPSTTGPRTTRPPTPTPATTADLRQSPTFEQAGSIIPPGPPPENVTATGTGPRSILLNWNVPREATSFSVYRGPSATGPWTQIRSVNNGSYGAGVRMGDEDNQLAPSLTAYYYVALGYKDGSKGTSAVVSGRTADWTPSSFSAVQTGPTTVGLYWRTDGLEWITGSNESYPRASFWITGPGVPGAGPANGENKHTIENVAPGTYDFMLVSYFDVDGFPTLESDLNTAPHAKLTVKPPAPPAGAAAGPKSGSYRVTLNGFKVVRESWDSVIDGKPGDEIRVLAAVHEVQQPKQSAGSVVTTTTSNRFTQEYQGAKTGTAMAGGCQRSGAPSGTGLPVDLWQGQLVEKKTAVVVVPTLWEIDGDSLYRTRWSTSERSAFDYFMKTCDPTMNFCPKASGGPWGLSTLYSKAPGIGAIQGQWNPSDLSPLGNPSDRPIGVDKHNWFVPAYVVINYDVAEAALAAPPAAGCSAPGTLAVEYNDNETLAGKYVLYLQIERTP
ncbi:MAG TPA: hypothetical protein VF200_03800 [Woeseiaceae bacterium]